MRKSECVIINHHHNSVFASQSRSHYNEINLVLAHICALLYRHRPFHVLISCLLPLLPQSNPLVNTVAPHKSQRRYNRIAPTLVVKETVLRCRVFHISYHVVKNDDDHVVVVCDSFEFS